MTGDIAKDQFALAARVACVDHAGDVFAFEQFGQQFQSCLGFLDRQQIKMRRDYRQVGKRPLAALDFEFFRHGDLHQMPYGGRQNILIALKIVIVALEAAQYARDIAGHRRLLSDN